MLENEVGGLLVVDDPRTTDCLKGYVLQPYHYLVPGQAFCDDDRCRLYDAHRQPALIRAPLHAPEFCERHMKLYDS